MIPSNQHYSDLLVKSQLERKCVLKIRLLKSQGQWFGALLLLLS